MSRDYDIDCFELIRKLEKRFNFVDLPETLQVQFMGAHQNATEKLEDLDDRLLSPAMKAFRDLPEEHIYSQAVWRFCQGCCDKEAGQHAAMSRPKSMEEAIDKVKWYQHTTKAIYGKPVRQREFSGDSDNEIESVRTINAAVKSERNFPPSTHQSDHLKSMEAQIQILVENMQTLQTKLTSMENKQRTRPQKTETRTCYNCEDQDTWQKIAEDQRD